MLRLCLGGRSRCGRRLIELGTQGIYLCIQLIELRGQGIGSGPTVLVVRTLKTGEEREITSRLVIERLYDGAAPKWFPGGGSVLVVMGRSANSGMGLLSSRPHEWQYRAPALSLWQPAGPFARRKNHLS